MKNRKNINIREENRRLTSLRTITETLKEDIRVNQISLGERRDSDSIYISVCGGVVRGHLNIVTNICHITTDDININTLTEEEKYTLANELEICIERR
tara:strand:+ start:285 stop:578 length:294 start_codon:yes stop_codon:yes gene_type:complete